MGDLSPGSVGVERPGRLPAKAVGVIGADPPPPPPPPPPSEEEEGEVMPEESPRRPNGMRIGGTRGGMELGSTWDRERE